MRGGQQRVLGVPYGTLQWKVWHRQQAELLAGLEDSELEARWRPLEAKMQRYNLAPDEVVLANELHERAGPLDACCCRCAVTYNEWEERSAREATAARTPRRAKSFQAVPEAAWAARAAAGAGFGALLCRKIALDRHYALEDWRQRLLSVG